MKTAVEPTPDMIDAGIEAMIDYWSDNIVVDGREHTPDMVRKIYLAMRRLEVSDNAEELK